MKRILARLIESLTSAPFAILLIAGAVSERPSLAAEPKLEVKWTKTNGGYYPAFSPDSRLILGHQDRQISVYSAKDGAVVNAFTDPDSTSPESRTSFSADSLLIGFIGITDVRLLRVSDGSVAATLQSARQDKVIFSPDGELVATIRDNDVRLWRVKDGQYVRALGISGYTPYAFGFSSEGRLAALGNNDGSITVWRVADGKLVYELNPNPPGGWMGRWVGSLAFSPDGEKIAAGYTGGYGIPSWPEVPGFVRLWEVATQKALWSRTNTTRVMGNGFYHLAFSSEGSFVVAADSTKPLLWFLRTSDGAVSFYDVRDPDPELDNQRTGAMTISPDGKSIAYMVHASKFTVAKMPLIITGIQQQDVQVVIRWVGGDERYQVQQRSQLASGVWENIGSPTTSNSSTNAASGTMFYRVVGLPEGN